MEPPEIDSYPEGILVASILVEIIPGRIINVSDKPKCIRKVLAHVLPLTVWKEDLI